MEKAQVRCWEMKVKCMCEAFETVWVTTIGIMGGYELFICKTCGEIFVLGTDTQLYLKTQLEEKMISLKCPTCDSILKETLAKYPKYFKCKKTGAIFNFDRPSLMPPEEDTIIKEFYRIM